MTNATPPTADELIARLDLQPHPEGGYFKETHRSSTRVCPVDTDRKFSRTARRHDSTRDFSASTAIYFLLKAGQISSLHRIAFDEVWHFYAGGSLAVYAITPDGEMAVWNLGMDLERGCLPQCVVPAGAWFGAEVVDGDYVLVGCTVAPGFEFVDFELADRSTLLSTYPRHETLIRQMTR